MKRLAIVLMCLALNGCAWMFHTVNDQGQLIDGDGKMVGHANHTPFGGSAVTCGTSRSSRTFSARCW